MSDIYSTYIDSNYLLKECNRNVRFNVMFLKKAINYLLIGNSNYIESP